LETMKTANEPGPARRDIKRGRTIKNLNGRMAGRKRSGKEPQYIRGWSPQGKNPTWVESLGQHFDPNLAQGGRGDCARPGKVRWGKKKKKNRDRRGLQTVYEN